MQIILTALSGLNDGASTWVLRLERYFQVSQTSSVGSGMWSGCRPGRASARLAGSQHGPAPVTPGFWECCLCHTGRKLSRSRNTPKHRIYLWVWGVWNQRQLDSKEISDGPVFLANHFS
jgi:hypothetical protein